MSTIRSEKNNKKFIDDGKGAENESAALIAANEQIESLKETIFQLEIELAAERQENIEQAQQINKITEELKHQKGKIETLETENGLLEEENDEEHKMLNLVQKENKILNQKLNLVQKANKKLNTKLDLIQKEKNEQDKKLDLVKNELGLVKNEFDLVQNELDLVKNENKEKNKMLDLVQNELDLVKKDVMDKDKKLKENEDKFNKMMNRLDQQDQEIADLKEMNKMLTNFMKKILNIPDETSMSDLIDEIGDRLRSPTSYPHIGKVPMGMSAQDHCPRCHETSNSLTSVECKKRIKYSANIEEPSMTRTSLHKQESSLTINSDKFTLSSASSRQRQETLTKTEQHHHPNESSNVINHAPGNLDFDSPSPNEKNF